MRYTDKVRSLGIRPELVLVLIAASEVEHDRGLDVWVTTIVNGTHGDKSLHYTGAAVDLDDVGNRNDRLALGLSKRLPPDYDVVDEGSHVHVEFQPKVALNA